LPLPHTPYLMPEQSPDTNPPSELLSPFFVTSFD
jgi:hypothetical protein